MKGSLAGLRIRERRRAMGLTQSALAKKSGISPSYLNLIEHNRRGIAGKVLLALARELDMHPSELSKEAELSIIADLREAAAANMNHNPETKVTEEFLSRFPGWARLLAGFYRQNRDQLQAMSALSDRLAHDPFLQESLHGMLTNITAIRSTSEILSSVDDITREERGRFDEVIHAESQRLTEVAQALVTYFDNAADESAPAATPQEELARFLEEHNFHFEELDNAAMHPTNIVPILNRMIELAPSLSSDPARRLARKHLEQYFTDAQALPLEQLHHRARETGYDILGLAHEFNVDLHQVFRRLAVLHRPGLAAPTFGLVVVNSSGFTLHRRPLRNFALPRHGSACALWPLFQSLSRPFQPMRRLCEMPDGTRFLTISQAQAASVDRFGQAPDYQAAMLFLPIEQAQSFAFAEGLDIGGTMRAEPIGPSCRVCVRKSCRARFEEQIIGT